MDFYEYSVVVIDLDAGEGEASRLTNNSNDVTYESITYTSSPALKLSPAALTGDFSSSEYKLENIYVTGDLLTRLSSNVPYPKIDVTIRELFYDDEGAVSKVEYLFRGLIYQVNYRRSQNYMEIVVKDYKYYLDTTGGLPCTEQCKVGYFGDTLCQAVVLTEDQVLESVSEFNATVASDLVNTTEYLYNKGYMEYGASRICIKYHKLGKTFEMSRPIPSYWIGKTVTLVAGCDKYLDTCRDIHDNEARFLGLGFSMVDYNSQYENP